MSRKTRYKKLCFDLIYYKIWFLIIQLKPNTRLTEWWWIYGSPAFQGKKAKPRNAAQDASVGAVNLGSVSLQGNLDLQLNSRHAGIRPAVVLHSLPVSLYNNSLFPWTLPLMVMKSKTGPERLTLKCSSNELPNNCNCSCWWGFLFLWPSIAYLLNAFWVLRLLVCQQELMVPYLKPNATLGGDERTVWDCFCSPLPAGRLWVGETCQYRQKSCLWRTYTYECNINTFPRKGNS